jgi:hypothetical protein
VMSWRNFIWASYHKKEIASIRLEISRAGPFLAMTCRESWGPWS